MDYQDRYDKLDNLIRNLEIAIDEAPDKYYADILSEIKYEAQDELNEVTEKLEEEQEREEIQQEKDYWREAI